MTEKLLTVSDVADLLSVSTSTVRRMCAVGKLPCMEVGVGNRRTYRISRTAIRCSLSTETEEAEETEAAAPSILDRFKRR